MKKIVMGLVEENENEEHGLIRELKEETGLEVVKYQEVKKFIYSNENLPEAEFRVYEVIKWKGKLFPSSELRDLDFRSFEEIKKLKLTPWAEKILRDIR